KFRRASHPCGDRDRFVSAVIEHDVSARKVPDIARSEIGNFGLVVGVNGGDAATPGNDISPFGGVCMPVKLTKSAWLKRHIDAGKLVGDRKSADIGLFRRAAGEGLGRHAAKRIAERWKLGTAERRR